MRYTVRRRQRCGFYAIRPRRQDGRTASPLRGRSALGDRRGTPLASPFVPTKGRLACLLACLLGHLTMLRASPATPSKRRWRRTAAPSRSSTTGRCVGTPASWSPGRTGRFCENVRANLRRHGYLPDERRPQRRPCSNKPWRCRRGRRGGVWPQKPLIRGGRSSGCELASLPSAPATSSAAIPSDPTKSGSCLHIRSDPRFVMTRHNSL